MSELIPRKRIAVGEGAKVYMKDIQSTGGFVPLDADRTPALSMAKMALLMDDHTVDPGQVTVDYIRGASAVHLSNWVSSWDSALTLLILQPLVECSMDFEFGHGYEVAIISTTGCLGRELVQHIGTVLPIRKLHLFASFGSQGEYVDIEGESIQIQGLKEAVLPTDVRSAVHMVFLCCQRRNSRNDGL